MENRGSGILLHITSLPSPYGIGDFGPGAYRFVDFLKKAKQSYWQLLPLGALNSDYNPSPYHCISAFAFNKFLISPELLIKDGLLNEIDMESLPRYPQGRVDYRKAVVQKEMFFHKAFGNFRKRKNKHDYDIFCSENSFWLEDFAFFISLKRYFKGKVWGAWPSEVRDRKLEAVQSLRKSLQEEIELEKFLQYIFFQQWSMLKHYCQDKNIKIIGDMPIYMDYNSADCWAHPDIFKLDKSKRPVAVSGVPPDYFSRTGQLWGNPVYRWDVLKSREYRWWIQRMEHSLKLYDMVRIDHFRGFVGYWEVPAGRKTAVKGRWVDAPALDFFNKLKKRFPQMPIIAEDLGFITPDVKKIINHFAFPGMKVLLFAFGNNNPMHPYLPHTYDRNCVVYTGTHDNNTVRGWFEREAKSAHRKRVIRYLGWKVPMQEIHWEFIKLAMMSVADLAIIPMQDVLGLGAEARMNRPATSKGNWEWRVLPGQVKTSLTKKLSEITKIYGRS